MLPFWGLHTNKQKAGSLGWRVSRPRCSITIALVYRQVHMHSLEALHHVQGEWDHGDKGNHNTNWENCCREKQQQQLEWQTYVQIHTQFHAPRPNHSFTHLTCTFQRRKEKPCAVGHLSLRTSCLTQKTKRLMKGCEGWRLPCCCSGCTSQVSLGVIPN